MDNNYQPHIDASQKTLEPPRASLKELRNSNQIELFSFQLKEKNQGYRPTPEGRFLAKRIAFVHFAGHRCSYLVSKNLRIAEGAQRRPDDI